MEIKNIDIPDEIKQICIKCETEIHCQNKGCAFRSLGNEYCDYVLNATKPYLELQNKIDKAIEYIKTYSFEVNDMEKPPFVLKVVETKELLEILGDKDE